MWFRNPEDMDWHYYGGAGDSKAHRLACGKPLFIKPGTQKSPLPGQPACVKCIAAASRLSRHHSGATPDAAFEPQEQAVTRAQTPRPPARPRAPRPQPLAPVQAAPVISPMPGAATQPAVVAPKLSYRWVRENTDSIWHYLASADAPGPICGALGVFGESRYNLPAKIERCARCGQAAARITRERVLNKRGVGATVPPSHASPARLAPPTAQPQPLPPATPATPAELRLEQVAAAGRKLSHLIEIAPEKPFPQVFAQLPRQDQEIIQEAMQQRVWSDLFLSPTAQKAAKAAREANRATNAAARPRDNRHAKPGRKSEP